MAGQRPIDPDKLDNAKLQVQIDLYDLNNYPQDIRPIIEVLLRHETRLSDGFVYYLPAYTADGDECGQCGILEAIAREILTAVNKHCQELSARAELLDEVNKEVMSRIPPCPYHGQFCVSHAAEWIQERVKCGNNG